jgi:nucleoside-diphosphate-sugar epimerase
VREGAGPVLVTGGTGFLGRPILQALSEAGLAVLAVARRPPDPPLPPETSFRALDVTAPDAVRDLVREARPRAVLHLAGCASPRAAERDREGAFRANTLSTLHLLEAIAKEAPRARVALASSAHVYGNAPGSLAEERPLDPLGTYAATKAAAEGIVRSFAAESGVDALVLRFFNLVGPGQSEDLALGSFASQIVDAERGGGGAVRVGDLEVRRDFLDVRDAAKAAALLLRREAPSGEVVFNVGRGEARAVRELFETLRAGAKVEIAVEVDPQRLRPGEAREAFADVERLRRVTGFAPAIPLDRSVADLLEEMRTRRR